MNFGMHVHHLSGECKTISCKLFPTTFKHCAQVEIHPVMTRKFQLGGRTEISAQAEIYRVVGP